MEFAAFVLCLLVAPSLLNTQSPVQEKKTLSFSSFVCVWVCPCLCARRHTAAQLICIRKSEASVKCLPLSPLRLMVLRQGLSLSLELTDSANRAGHWAPGNLPCLCPALGLQRQTADTGSPMGAEGRTQILQRCGEQGTSWADSQLQEYSLISFDLGTPFCGVWWLRWPFPDNPKMGPDDHGGLSRQRK